MQLANGPNLLFRWYKLCPSPFANTAPLLFPEVFRIVVSVCAVCWTICPLPNGRLLVDRSMEEDSKAPSPVLRTEQSCRHRQGDRTAH